jgi:hypothetical protein
MDLTDPAWTERRRPVWRPVPTRTPWGLAAGSAARTLQTATSTCEAMGEEQDHLRAFCSRNLRRKLGESKQVKVRLVLEPSWRRENPTK